MSEIIVDNFAGGGGASTGIELAVGRSVDIAINHDPAAIAMHRANHPDTEHYCENVWDVDPVKACRGRPVALAWFSPDCFVADTLILTTRGYTPIQDVKIGDLVLTHKMRWRRVTSVMQSQKETVMIKGKGNFGLVCSEEHPFYTRRRYSRWIKADRVSRAALEDPGWTKANNLVLKKDYWGTPLDFERLEIPTMVRPNNKIRIFDIDEKLLFLAGLYVGDGWSRLTDRRAELVICCGKHKAGDLARALSVWTRKSLRPKDGELKWNYRETRTEIQFSVHSRALVTWLRENFGHLAHNKFIPAWLLSADVALKKAFVSGYEFTDGNEYRLKTNTLVSFITVSKKLCYGYALLVSSLGYFPYVNPGKRNPDVIEGRKVNVRPIYRVLYRRTIASDHCQHFVDKKICWNMIKERIPMGKQTVYNLSVEEDESYVAENIIVHNCTYFSKCKAGKPRDKSIRGLAWVAVRWAAAVKPRVIMLENVEEFQTWGPLLPDNTPDPAQKGRTFKYFVHALKRYGYEVQYRELRACDFGAPTSRKRFFLIARCDGQKIRWPSPTHGPANGPDVLQGRLKPYRSASEILDFSLEGKSIFTRNKPLCDNSLRRIVRGLRRFVFECHDPFVIRAVRQNSADCRELCTGFIAKCFAGNYTGAGAGLDRPLPTITTIDHNALVVPYFVMLYGCSNAGSVLDPLPTITAAGQHIAEVEALLSHYQDELGGNTLNRVTIKGQLYQIADIRMRMLTPRELFNGQGFPEDYIIDHDADGKHYTKTAQIARCGNAVPPPFAEALTRANLPELCTRKLAAA